MWGRFFLFMMLLGGSSYAQECVDRDSCCYNYYSSGNHQLEIGGNYTYLHFKPEGLGSISGSLGGLFTSYEYLPVNSIYQGVTFLWRQGSLSGSGVSRLFFDIDTQARLGYTFRSLCDLGIISLFTGLGYRHMGEILDLIDLNYIVI